MSYTKAFFEKIIYILSMIIKRLGRLMTDYKKLRMKQVLNA